MTMLYKISLGLILSLVLFMPQMVSAAGPAAVNLGTSGEFAILSQSGISTTGATSIVGDIGVSPAAASYLTGFSLVISSNNEYSTSSYLTGVAFAANYNVPTPAIMTQAVSDMQTAYNNAAGASTSNATTLNLASGNLNGQTLTPGVYTWGTAVTITQNITFSGSGVYILQVSGTLNTASGAHIILTNGAQAQDIFWQVAGQTTLGTTSVFQGIILDKTGIIMQTGATLTGAALAQTAVTLDAATVTQSTGSGTVPLNGTSTATTTIPGTNLTTTIAATTIPTTTIQQGSISTTIAAATTTVSSQGNVSTTSTTKYQGAGTYLITSPDGSTTDQYISSQTYFNSLLSNGDSLAFVSHSNMLNTTTGGSTATSSSGSGGSTSANYCTSSYGFLQGIVAWLYQLLGWKC